MDQKQKLRKLAKERRNHITEHERQSKSKAICEALLASAWYRQYTRILVYAAIQSEVDLRAFCAQALKEHKQLYFPKVFGKEMEFYQITSFDQLEEGAFSVPEPDIGHNTLPVFEKTDAAWLILPGVAFDECGMRLGYGAGFYDRYLKTVSCVHKTGAAFEAQIVRQIPAEPYDQPMDDVVTEQTWYQWDRT